MKLTRRQAFALAGTLAGTSFADLACTEARPRPRLLPSRLAIPEPFQTELPVPRVLKPARTDGAADYYEMAARPASAEPIAGVRTNIWGYDGTFPGPTIEARSGRAALLTLRNSLPVPIVNHLHGGRTESLSDGYPTDFVLPGTGERFTGGNPQRSVSGVREYRYENRQRAAQLWYHDHRMDFSGAQVWRGLAGIYLLRDEEEDRLPLPRGAKEIPLVICDRSFEADGSLAYPSIDSTLRGAPGVTHAYMGGVLGDVILVNGAAWPRVSVSNTRYRFRVLNASNARRYDLALDPAPAQGPAFVQIGSDGGLLGSPIRHRTVRIAPAERFDLIVDFSAYPVGTAVTLRNLSDSGKTGAILRFQIDRKEKDDSAIPERLSSFEPVDIRNIAKTREFDFRFDRTSHIWTINGRPFDEARIDADPRLDSTEIWRLRSDFNHPLHLHLVHFQVLSHGGPPGRWDAGWKDTIDMEPGQATSIAMRFSGYRGKYVFHCHNLEHEDMAMMANMEVV
ncbi:MAG TPA: multicopper oxidase family protein [Bryobacteraceae bacterium]|nr:multicopper oxidase family protein [Bryobacteraceae bacterium]